MRIEQLEYLAAVTRYGSLRRASDQLHVSQLYHQRGHPQARTRARRHPAGPAPLRRADQPRRPRTAPADRRRAGVGRAAQAAAGDQLATRRLLRIGTVNAGTASLVLPALRAFQAENGRSAVEVRNLQQDEIHVSLSEGNLDLGLVNLLDGDDVPPDLEATALLAGRPAAVLPTGHPSQRGPRSRPTTCAGSASSRCAPAT
nr:hypothetical protein GCM10020092_037400 [Actinoplanes digitatis]